jgi:hypothetical protein
VQRIPGERRIPVGALVVGGVVVAALVAFVAVVVADVRQGGGGGAPAGVETVDVGPGGRHTPATVNYGQTPPAGGEHNPVWQNAGFYAEPIHDETAVHTLEHGAVWITYSPDLPEDQVGVLRDLAQGQDCVLASPYKGLPSPVVASSWGKQLELEGAEDPDLERFVRAYKQGPETPEPGAACTGGIGQPA